MEARDNVINSIVDVEGIFSKSNQAFGGAGSQAISPPGRALRPRRQPAQHPGRPPDCPPRPLQETLEKLNLLCHYLAGYLRADHAARRPPGPQIPRRPVPPGPVASHPKPGRRPTRSGRSPQQTQSIAQPQSPASAPASSAPAQPPPGEAGYPAGHNSAVSQRRQWQLRTRASTGEIGPGSTGTHPGRAPGSFERATSAAPPRSIAVDTWGSSPEADRSSPRPASEPDRHSAAESARPGAS